jgi:hypothetical protein
MEAKWPFLVLLIFFLGLTGYVVSRLERTKVMNNWEKRRCEIPVMVGANFFKPDTDTRSPTEFSVDNFKFCTKQYSDTFLAMVMGPFSWLLEKQVSLTSKSLGIFQVVKQLVARLFAGFMTYLNSFLGKYRRGINGLRRIIIYLRMAVQRMMAIAVSTIYMGMTIFRGMVTGIQVVIRVVLIICAIMLAVIILLWFVLFPVIPIIMSALTAIVSMVVVLGVVMSGSLASEAESKKGGFCMAGETWIPVSPVPKRACQVQVGDVFHDGSRVTATMEMTGEGVSWYAVDGILLSGDHLVRGTDGEWHPVHEDPRACPLPHMERPRVYCFNTTTQCIPVTGLSGQTVWFRDWEELSVEDEEGHTQWVERVLQMLNGEVTEAEATEAEATQKAGQVSMEIPLWSPMTEIQVPGGWKTIVELGVGDEVMDGRTATRILGKVHGETEADSTQKADNQWTTGGYQWQEGRWSLCQGSLSLGQRGWNLITESGVFQVRRGDEVIRSRDFTEVGYDRIQETYPFVLERLRKCP